MNAIGTQLRDPINSGLTRWRMTVVNKEVDAAAEFGRNPVSKHQIQTECGDEQAYAGRDCRTRLARPNSQGERGQGNINLPCSADHEQNWQPYPFIPTLALCDAHTCAVLILVAESQRVGEPRLAPCRYHCSIYCTLVLLFTSL